MEFLLLWWDELDDWLHACRHLAATAAGELSGMAIPLAAGASALGAWLLAAHAYTHTASLGGFL
jgi:hypothetical protein